MKSINNFSKAFFLQSVLLSVMFILFLFIFKTTAKEEAFITSIELDKKPIINKNQISYKIDLNFDSAPFHFWIYMDKKENKLVLDFYGTSIHTSHDIEINDGKVIKYLSIRNEKSQLALNNRRSQIFFKTEPDWHFRAERVSDKTIKITLWKKLKGPELRRMKGINPFIYAFTFSGSIIIAFLAVVIINKTR